MKNIKTKHSLLILIVGFFFYSLLIDIPKLIQNLALIFGYIINLKDHELITLKISTWILISISIVILLIIKSKSLYKEKTDNQFNAIFNRKALLILGFFAIVGKAFSFLSKNIESKLLTEYLERNASMVSASFISEIYFFDGYLFSSLILILLITFFVIIFKLK